MSIATFLVVGVGLLQSPASQPASAPAESIHEQFQRESKAVTPLVTSEWVKRWLDAAAELPAIKPRILYVDPKTRTWLSAAAFAKLDAKAQAAYTKREMNEQVYYTTKYGTPLAYARPLDLLAANGVSGVAGKKVLDFGYGTIGHLRMLASRGADATGVDVDSMLTALYCEAGDTGTIKGGGRITLVNGRFPTEPDIRKQVGGGYDIFISKNTLKMGYVHPAEKVDPRMLLNIGVDDEAFVKAMYDVLKPGGIAMIYNICPAPAAKGKPYIPWSDGRCPFDRTMIEKAGFEVVSFDTDDTKACCDMARALGWDKGDGAMDLEHDLFAHYSIFRKPAK